MEHRVYSGDSWPLFEIRVAIHDQGRSRIHFSIDELIVDGLSVDTLMRQWGSLYAQPGQAQEALTLSFRDYVLAMKAFEGSQRYKQDLAYWLERLSQLPGGPRLPGAVASGAGEGRGGAHRMRLHYWLPAAGWTALQTKAAELGVSPTALVLGVFAEVLRAWTDSTTFTLVLTSLNRPPLHPQMRELIGPAISSLLFVVEEAPGEDLEEVIVGHHQRLWQDLDHGSVSGIQVLRQLRQRGSRQVPSVLPVVFTSMLGSEASSEPLHDLGEVVYVVNQTPQVYLDHQVRESSEGLACSWDVAQGHLDAGFMQAMFQAYGEALSGLAEGRLAWTRASLKQGVRIDPTIQLLSDYLTQAQGEDPHAPFALTDQQQAYAFGRDVRLGGGGGSCQFYQALYVHKLDVARLEQVLAKLVQRHPMLRTVVQADGSQTVMAEAPRQRIDVADLSRLDGEASRAALQATQQALLEHVTPLGEWPYCGVKVSLLERERACVHLCFDLLLVDSTSIGQLLGELVQLYGQGQLLAEAPALSFRDYQRAVERYRGTRGQEERLGYWQRKFAELPGGPQLPRRAGWGEAHQRIGGELTSWQTLKRQAVQRGIEPGLVLLTAYLEVLYQWNGQRPLAVVVPGWDRLAVHPDIGRVVGDFTTLSWVARTVQPMSLERRLEQVAQQRRQDLAQRPVSGLQALRRVMLRDRQRPLQYPVVFTDQVMSRELADGVFELGEGQSKTPQVWLDNLSGEAAGVLRCDWDFAAGEYAPAMIQEMFDGYLRVLELLGSDERAWLRSDFSDSIRARPDAYLVVSDRLEGVV